MRKFLPIAILCCTIFITSRVYNQVITGNGPTLSHPGGMSGPPVGARDASAFQNLVNINGQDGFYLKKDLYLVNYVTIINGQRVMGIPFLFPEWLEGSLTTPDGRVYTEYKYKYNVQNQTISFMGGTDSLEVNEDIKEFTLKYVMKDSAIQLRFVHSNQYQKNGASVYYEVLADDPKGQLLKLNKKVVANTGDGIIANRTSKYLKAEPSYFYYNKSTKKLQKIKENSDMRSILSIPEENVAEMNIDTFDLSREDNIIRLIKLYFEKARLKVF
jgi:hypothetical protein